MLLWYQLSAGVAFLEDIPWELTWVFQLWIEEYCSSCMKQEVHYVMTRTKKPCLTKTVSCKSKVKSKVVPQMETSCNVVRAWRNRACNVQMQQLSSRPRGDTGGQAPTCLKRGEAGLPQSTTAERNHVLNIPESEIKTQTRLNAGIQRDIQLYVS